jgi:alpha,alpha-trehalose phosphorylase
MRPSKAASTPRTIDEPADPTDYAAVTGYLVHPWKLGRRGLNLDDLASSESLFSLANGHIGMRGSLDEGEPRAVPGTYINGFFEERPMPQAEAGYGFTESGQTVVNVTDGKIIRLFVGDSPFDLRYGTILHHERTLDLRTGTLDRRSEWTSPNGSTVRVTSRRLVSFTQRSLAAICYEVEALSGDLYVALQSDLLANEPGGAASDDPRDAAALDRPLVGELSAVNGHRAVLVHSTRLSKLRVAAGMDHLLEAPGDVQTTNEAEGDLGRYTVTALLPRGTRLRLVKLLAYDWSHRRSAPALRDQVEAALAIGRLVGWDGLLSQQREFLDAFWDRADVQIEGDDGLQQAVRVSMFHVLQSAARSEGQGLGAKGLSGIGYDGHTFWDAETFALPMLTYTMPEAARDHLRWRHSTLGTARDRAAELGLAGATFPWRTINGKECSGYWPAGTAAFHVNAAVADATARYFAVTGDDEFESACGLELLVETARLWASLGHFEHGDFRIDGVTGPDEYTAVVDDNLYTNAMAQKNLCEAIAACGRQPEGAAALDVDEQELDAWRRAADALVFPYDERLEVHAQSEGFTAHEEWDFEGTRDEDYPLLLHFPYFQLYRKQVIKQADVVLAMHLRGDLFTAEQKARNFAYYEARTVRDSSLSAGTQAIVAAETGHLDLAYDYWAEVAFVDLGDLHGNVDDGLHLAAMGSSWLVAVAGFGGMRDHDGRLAFAPRLPPALGRICFRLTFAGRQLRVDIRRLTTGAGTGADAEPGAEATYELLSGEPLLTLHHGTEVTLRTGDPLTLPVPETPDVAPVTQPHGRAPQKRVAQTYDAD